MPRMALADFSLLMVTSMLENGKMIRHMETVTITTRRVHITRAIGMKISSMGMAGKSGPTKAHMKAATRMD